MTILAAVIRSRKARRGEFVIACALGQIAAHHHQVRAMSVNAGEEGLGYLAIMPAEMQVGDVRDGPHQLIRYRPASV